MTTNFTKTYSGQVKEILTKLYGAHKRDFSLFDITTIAMGLVEAIGITEKKKEYAEEFIPSVIVILQSLGYISEDQAEKLLDEIKVNLEMIDHFIETAISISKHPLVIDTAKKIKCTSCNII